MQIDLTAEQEAQLSEIAAHEGKGADELAREVFSRGLAAEAHFIAAVKIGQQAASRGDFVEQSEIGPASSKSFGLECLFAGPPLPLKTSNALPAIFSRTIPPPLETSLRLFF